MDPGRVELVRSLFVAMTEQAEALHESAMNGQAFHPSHVTYAETVARLLNVAEALCSLANAATVLCEADDADTRE